MIKKTLFKSISIILLAMSLFSCSSIEPKDYKENNPKLDIRSYLNGKVKAWGMLEDRSGKVTRRFRVEMEGKWNGNEGVLEEYFTFDDGEKSKRIWTIKFSDDHNFTATAGDVIGVAKGSQYGNAMQMEYVLDLEVDKEKKTKYKVTLDDWMYLLDDDILVNKSTIKKFGITFGKLTIFFQKQ
ncbi:MAG: hypothetical protein ACI9IL_000244 [Rickettsiales bacterium]|jgi:hypothetical protein